jgi:F420-dependent oxidoreductase-like protein
MTRLGYQIPNFTYPGVAPGELFGAVVRQAREADASGFDTVMVMDHFYQLPVLGPPEHEMFEAYTLLGGIAARTRTARLGTLVTGVTYRNPALLAKEVTALDVISRGRAYLGIGAAWFDQEHDALGFDFPPVRQRFEMLEDALRICRGMFRGERPTVDGAHFRVRDAINSPAPVQPGGPPIMIGGGGERRTLRLVAEHADMWNLNGSLADVPRKLEVLESHCADVGRDIASVNKTMLNSLILGPTMEAAEAKRDELLRSRGFDWSSLDEATRQMVGARFVVGDPDTAGERCAAMLEAGLDGLTFNMPADAHDLEAVAAAGELLTKVLAGRPA